MMNGYENGGYMMGAGWGMIVGLLVCLAIIGVVVWFLAHLVQKRQSLPLQQQPLSSQERTQGYQPRRDPVPQTFQEGGNRSDGPKEDRYPYTQEQPVK